jgi:hypothetical protein
MSKFSKRIELNGWESGEDVADELALSATIDVARGDLIPLSFTFRGTDIGYVTVRQAKAMRSLITAALKEVSQ